MPRPPEIIATLNISKKERAILQRAWDVYSWLDSRPTGGEQTREDAAEAVAV